MTTTDTKIKRTTRKRPLSVIDRFWAVHNLEWDAHDRPIPPR